MKIRTLRTVLLIQAIEESDRGGDVLPSADRAEATREAVRTAPPGGAIQPGIGLASADETLLALRAERLLARVRLRSPAVDYVLAVAGGLTWLGRAALVLALIVGLSLSALDGGRRINILAFPLVGLIAWNFFIYALVIAARIRRRGATPPGTLWSGRFYERWIAARIDSLLKQSMRFNAPLATALRRFTGEWVQVEHPLLLERAQRLMHCAAALVAAGLIAGLYVRGIVWRYEAGWESTFLSPESVHALLAVLYGPGALLSGIGLPSISGVNALRWTGTSGGGEAASWIHLMALTAMLYIIVPRLFLACVSGFNLWRLSRNPPLPAALIGYGRTVLASTVGGARRESVSVSCFAYEPCPASIAGLETLLAATLGAIVKVEMRATIRYGQEDEFRTSLTRSVAVATDWNVLLMTAAATPEAENHGAVINTLRDSLARESQPLPLLIVIDTGPYAARMQGDATFEQRLRERRNLWSEFVAGYGLSACLVDLARITPESPAAMEAQELARASLWSAGGSS
ncbi:MAG TPA: DUF2868 domain-containing protein [Xanthomonadaceae bacterium]|nr:DUF2868 domain-containing protein [Xanthomonadaceae bacterium]